MGILQRPLGQHPFSAHTLTHATHRPRLSFASLTCPIHTRVTHTGPTDVTFGPGWCGDGKREQDQHDSVGAPGLGSPFWLWPVRF